MSHRIAVTGLGVVSSLGCGRRQFEEALFKGGGAPNGQSPDGLDPESLEKPPPAYLARDFNPAELLGRKGLRPLDRAARLLAAAGRLALDDSGLAQRLEESSDRVGLINGTLFGGLHSIVSFDRSILEDGPRLVNPMAFANTVINAPAGQAAIRLGLRGANSTICPGLGAGLQAIRYAADFLASGRAEALLAGGAEELAPEACLGFRRSGRLSESGHLRPFRGDGTVLGEASALLALETSQSARSRGAALVAELAGWGECRSAPGHAPSQSLRKAIEQALGESDLRSDEIGALVCGANGNTAEDAAELAALEAVFGDRLGGLPACAPKAAFGETMGAAGALLAASAALALARGECPPTPGADGSAGLALSVKPRPLGAPAVLVTQLTCEGQAAALILRR